MVGSIAHLCPHGLTREWCPKCQPNARIQALVDALQEAGDVELAKRRHPSWQGKGKPNTRGPATLAKFDSICPWCGDRIDEGQDFCYKRANEWVCEECAQDYDEDSGEG